MKNIDTSSYYNRNNQISNHTNSISSKTYSSLYLNNKNTNFTKGTNKQNTSQHSQSSSTPKISAKPNLKLNALSPKSISINNHDIYNKYKKEENLLTESKDIDMYNYVKYNSIRNIDSYSNNKIIDDKSINSLSDENNENNNSSSHLNYDYNIRTSFESGLVLNKNNESLDKIYILINDLKQENALLKEKCDEYEKKDNENILFKQRISKLLDIKLILNENNTCQKKYGEEIINKIEFILKQRKELEIAVDVR
jgi:hypothetical protein